MRRPEHDIGAATPISSPGPALSSSGCANRRFLAEIEMTIQVGDRIPNATLNFIQDGVQAVNTDEIFKGKKVVLFSVPGAFTPTCSAKHLPGYVEKAGEFQKRGIDVACMAVNDAFVMKAWAK